MTIKFSAGKKFHRWTVLGPRQRGDRNRAARWLCRCDCGNEAYLTTSTVSQELSTGCRSCSNTRPNNPLELPSEIYQRLSSIARSAIRRCTNAAYPQWKDYGGRGIQVYDEWISDYRKFVQYLATLDGHDDDSLELDRTDNDGNYEPGNLRFVTRSVSMLNRRKPTRRD